MSWEEKELYRATFLDPEILVSTVGMDEQAIRENIKAQEKEGSRLDQVNLFQL